MSSSAMAKKSYKQTRKSEKVQVGCMSRQMHMLDFIILLIVNYVLVLL
jgi:hypothetical protein